MDEDGRAEALERAATRVPRLPALASSSSRSSRARAAAATEVAVGAASEREGAHAPSTAAATSGAVIGNARVRAHRLREGVELVGGDDGEVVLQLLVRGAREIGRGGDQDQAALALLRLERGDERARHLEARRLGVRGRGRGDRRRDHRAFAQWREGGRDERNATTPRREPGATPRARPPLR